ncbi:MAG: peptidylprolyl isomerase [Clostridia bacterium]|nr:peptidylprolyl isomerase [Clostridia bacterium]
MKRIFALYLLLAVTLCFFVSCEALEIPEGYEKSKNATDLVCIFVKDYGPMVIELYPDVAPITVANFKKLVSDGFYDGLTFHRIIKSFMIQGGDPEGLGIGGSKDTIYGEFSSNGFNNTLSHERGVISMARNDSPNSASSQFFICHATVQDLDGNYAAFGKLIEGYDVLDAIATTKTTTEYFKIEGYPYKVPFPDRPVNKVVISKIVFLTERSAQ